MRGRSQFKGENIEDYFWGLSNHSCAGVVQMDRVSAFQAEDAGSSPVTCLYTPVAQRTEHWTSNPSVGGSNPSWRANIWAGRKTLVHPSFHKILWSIKTFV